MFCWYPAVTCTSEPWKLTFSKPCLSKTGSFSFAEGSPSRLSPLCAVTQGVTTLLGAPRLGALLTGTGSVTPAPHPEHHCAAAMEKWTPEKGLGSLSSPGPGCLPGPPLKTEAIGCRCEPLFLPWACFLLLFNQTCCGREHLWTCPTTRWISFV